MEEMERYGKVEVRMNKAGLDGLQTARPEDEKLRRLVEAGYDCRRGGENSWEVLYHLSHLRGNLTGWLPIGAQDTVLEFGADTGQLTGGYLAKAGRVICMEESISRCRILAMRYEKAENLEVWAGDLWENLERTGGNGVVRRPAAAGADQVRPQGMAGPQCVHQAAGPVGENLGDLDLSPKDYAEPVHPVPRRDEDPLPLKFPALPPGQDFPLQCLPGQVLKQAAPA